VGTRFSAPVQTGTGNQPASCTMGTVSFPGGKERPGCDADPSNVPVHFSRKSRAMPLIPLCAVRPVQRLSTCTMLHFTFIYISIPLFAVRPVKSLSACTTVTLTLPIPLLHLCAVRPVQSLIVCTAVHFTFTYTSNPPMCRTACTEPQCLYNGALYLYLYV